MKRILVIGQGPAGISAAVYAKRGGAAVTVVANGVGALEKAERIENYYGFGEPLTGKELAAQGVEGAKRLGVDFIQGELVGLRFKDTMDGFIAETPDAVIEADAVVLAMGASRLAPPLAGVKELEGHGVSYCAICDAFFYRGKEAAVLGAGDYALAEAAALLPHAAKVHLLTNGEAVPARLPAGVLVHGERIAAVEGEGRVERVVFADGRELPVSGVFVAVGTAGSTAIAKKLGILLDGVYLKVDETMATNVPGVFAAGDATGGLLQVAKAVHEGAVAGLSALKFLRGKKA
ncbi:NAD(P)/FAD-dependent oxidoreductase [Selenomonas sp.]|uniref:NAD(P)/FAD-dependent oxidoreductase n=1 Tax=Selenomonas sp. TaxID=2053611 RepID=UPI003FA3014C